jgi:hypothetical protein
MSDATTATDETVFVPRGRPVLRFVTALVLFTALLGVIWETGMFNPRLELTVESFQLISPGEAVVNVRNQGRVQARVRVVGLDGRLVRLAAPSREVRLSGGASGRLVVRYNVDCAAYEAGRATPTGETTPVLRLVVRARGPIGPDRERRWPRGDEVSLAAVCGEG